ncbi:MAG: hypothetical protein FJ147_18580 [Deltaproteobacteria bacterium]|nr:hypothetical protein [Deltaproteobacteria bacterium]
MKQIDTFTVTQKMLNPVGTLAAPRMLTRAHQAGFAALGVNSMNDMSLVGYRAEFKEGARGGDTVNVTVEEAEGLWAGDRGFRIHFSKGNDTSGRVGKWHVIYAKKQEARPLPYDISQAVADKLTDRELWQPEIIIATGDEIKDAPPLLWPIGQSARAYMKQLDLAYATEPGVTIVDDIEKRIYAGIAVTVHFARWPQAGQELRCVLQHQRPLKEQAPSRRMEFHGVLAAQDKSGTYLLGTCRFSVSRVGQNRAPVYADGTAGQ